MRGNGVPVPLPILAGERRSPIALAYTMTATCNTSNRKKCAFNFDYCVIVVWYRHRFNCEVSNSVRL